MASHKRVKILCKSQEHLKANSGISLLNGYKLTLCDPIRYHCKAANSLATLMDDCRKAKVAKVPVICMSLLRLDLN